jgi:hypothetical protein
MNWPINPALARLNDAALTYRELHGLDAMMTWLSYEAQRLRAYRNIVMARRAAAKPDPDARLDPEHEKTLIELDFYADPNNYLTAKRKPVSEVMKDGGARARARLKEIEGRDGDDANDETGE